MNKGQFEVPTEKRIYHLRDKNIEIALAVPLHSLLDTPTSSSLVLSLPSTLSNSPFGPIWSVPHSLPPHSAAMPLLSQPSLSSSANIKMPVVPLEIDYHFPDTFSLCLIPHIISTQAILYDLATKIAASFNIHVHIYSVCRMNVPCLDKNISKYSTQTPMFKC